MDSTDNNNNQSECKTTTPSEIKNDIASRKPSTDTRGEAVEPSVPEDS